MADNWLQHNLGTFSLQLAWTIGQNEVLVLYGPSGAGKSLTLRSVAGLLRPNQGRVEVARRAVFDSDMRIWVPPYQRNIGYVPQQYALFPHLTTSQNIAYGMANSYGKDKDRHLARLLDSLHIAELADRYPDEISGGQQQRVALARALATRPKLLLLDEPLAALDPDLRIELRQELRHILESQAIPTLLVTHDRDDVLTLGHRVLLMDSGRVVAEGDPVSVLRQPGMVNVARVMEAENLFHGRVIERSLSDGTMVCTVDSSHLVLPLVDVPEDGVIQFGLRAADVLLATVEPHGISAQNVLKGAIGEIKQQGQEVYVQVNCGVSITALVTPRAVVSLNLRQGLVVWVVIKAMSFFLIGQR